MDTEGLSIEGESVRTENADVNLIFNNMVICVVEERVGGAIHLRSNLEDCSNSSKLDSAAILENPQVAFSSADLAATRNLSASEGALSSLSGVPFAG